MIFNSNSIENWMSVPLRELFIMPNIMASKIWEFLEHGKAFFFKFQV
jgi:hypothetical protein